MAYILATLKSFLGSNGIVEDTSIDDGTRASGEGPIRLRHTQEIQRIDHDTHGAEDGVDGLEGCGKDEMSGVEDGDQGNHDNAATLFQNITFKSPEIASQSYINIWGECGERDGNRSYTYTCALFTGKGRPDPPTGEPGDLYIDLHRDRIFVRLDDSTWSQWTPSNLGSKHQIEHPFIPDTFLWCKRKFGIQWTHIKNLKSDKSKRKGELMHTADAIKATMGHAHRSKADKARRKVKSQPNEDSEEFPQPRPSVHRMDQQHPLPYDPPFASPDSPPRNEFPGQSSTQILPPGSPLLDPDAEEYSIRKPQWRSRSKKSRLRPVFEDDEDDEKHPPRKRLRMRLLSEERGEGEKGEKERPRRKKSRPSPVHDEVRAGPSRLHRQSQKSRLSPLFEKGHVRPNRPYHHFLMSASSPMPVQSDRDELSRHPEDFPIPQVDDNTVSPQDSGVNPSQVDDEMAVIINDLPPSRGDFDVGLAEVPPPRDDDEAPPVTDDMPPPQDDDEAPPVTDDIPPPRDDDEAPPVTDDIPPPRDDDEAHPVTDNIPPSQDDDEAPPVADDIPPPQDNDIAPPRGHTHMGPVPHDVPPSVGDETSGQAKASSPIHVQMPEVELGPRQTKQRTKQRTTSQEPQPSRLRRNARKSEAKDKVPTIRLPSMQERAANLIGSATSHLTYPFQQARKAVDAFMKHETFHEKAKIIIWVNGIKTLLPGGPLGGRNAVSHSISRSVNHPLTIP
jgi:hypothetical protein